MPLIDLKAALYAANARVLELPRHRGKHIGVQRRVAATDQDQIALNLAFDHLARHCDPCLEPMVPTQGIKRIKRRNGLGHACGQQPHRGCHFLKHGPRLGIRNDERDLPFQVGLFDQFLGGRDGLTEQVVPPQNGAQ